MTEPRPTRAWVAALCSIALLVPTGCGRPGEAPTSPPTDPGPAAQALIDGLNRSDLSGVPANEDVQAELREILKGMDQIQPTVTAGQIVRSGDQATIPLTWTWPFATGNWEYPSTATLQWIDDRWVLDWDPQVVQPQLTVDTRLVHTHTVATRGRITAKDGVPIAEEMVVTRLGIDKSQVDEATAESSARALAELAGVNADAYTARVRASGPKAFVEAITLRPDDAREGWQQIPGAVSLTAKRTLATSREFAPEILGIMGEASPEQIRQSRNTLFPGDPAGVSGLQKRWDEQLRGRPGTKVSAVARTAPTNDPSPTPGAPTASPTPTARPITLFDAPPVAGTDLATGFDPALQMKAEQALVPVNTAAAIVAVQPSTGKILAAATSGASQGNPDATFGRFAPGSTFKVVTALALLRSGLTPSSTVNCTPNATVDGRVFKNYDDYPATKLGSITLAEALAYSCNTAFINESGRITPEALRDAAASLGLGQDYDAGFPSFFGNIPQSPSPVGKAEALIGQGQVEASPMAMAAVAASVQARHTVQPWLLESRRPPTPGKPLSEPEASALQQMMQLTVAQGSAAGLRGVVQGAKSGTAEFGTEVPPRTHAWMIAYQGDLAVAVLVTDAGSGSRDAGPLIRRLLG